MIKATFIKKNILPVIGLVCGLFLIALFVFIYFKDSTATIRDLLFGIILGAVICVFSIVCLFHNFKAYIQIDENGHITGKYHFFGKLCCEISDIDYVLGRNTTLLLHLKNGKCHTIMGIDSPWEIGNFIRTHLSFEASTPPQELIQELKNLKSDRKKGIIYICVCWFLMLLLIFVTMYVTDSKDLHEFTKSDWTAFYIMCVIELLTVVAMFIFADKTGKLNTPILRQEYFIKRTIIETQPLPPGYILDVFTDVYYESRVISIGFPHDKSVYYIAQIFDKNFNLINDFESDLIEDHDHVIRAFDGMINITDKF